VRKIDAVVLLLLKPMGVVLHRRFEAAMKFRLNPIIPICKFIGLAMCIGQLGLWVCNGNLNGCACEALERGCKGRNEEREVGLYVAYSDHDE
jgi:hypothetical protein